MTLSLAASWVELWQSLPLAMLGLAGAILVGVLVLVRARRWRRSAQQARSSGSEILSQFRELHRQGQLSREEFERIRKRLAGEIRREMLGPDKPLATGEQATNSD